MIFRLYEDPVNYVDPVILLFIGLLAIITAKIRKKKSFFTLFVLCFIGILSGFGIIIYYVLVKEINIYRGDGPTDVAKEIKDKFNVGDKEYEDFNLKALAEGNEDDFFLTPSDERTGILIKSSIFLVMEALVVVVFRHQYLEDLYSLPYF